MSQAALFAAPEPPPVAGIDLRCCDVAEVLAEVRGANLVIADPPWMYRAGVPGHGRMADHYAGLTIPEIVEHLDAAWDCAADDAYLLVWATWPILMQDPSAPGRQSQDSFPLHGWGRWSGVSGGAWGKLGMLGTGYHWRGQSEPLLLYRKGRPKPCDTIRNLGITERRGGRNPGNSGTTHSEKPLPWTRAHVRAFCPPGGLVLDLYAGMAPMARACAFEGRHYIGAEIDPKRHRQALDRLALSGAR